MHQNKDPQSAEVASVQKFSSTPSDIPTGLQNSCLYAKGQFQGYIRLELSITWREKRKTISNWPQEKGCALVVVILGVYTHTQCIYSQLGLWLLIWSLYEVMDKLALPSFLKTRRALILFTHIFLQCTICSQPGASTAIQRPKPGRRHLQRRNKRITKMHTNKKPVLTKRIYVYPLSVLCAY